MMKSKIRIAILIVLIVILAVSVSFFARDVLRSHAEDSANQDLADEVNRLRESVKAESAATTAGASLSSAAPSTGTAAAGVPGSSVPVSGTTTHNTPSRTTAAPVQSTAVPTQTAGSAADPTERIEQTGRTRPGWLSWLFGEPAQISTTEPTAAPEQTSQAAQTTQAAQGTASQAPQTTTAEPETDDSGMLPQYASLYKRNNDMAGWLTIKGTDIDNAVMYTPYDLEKYLHLGFNQKYAQSGSLFLGQGYVPGGNYAIIYGHHMRNGMMFSDLLNYASASFASSHPTIQFDTLYAEQTYTVVAAFYSKVYTDEEPDAFRYYAYVSLPTQEIFDYYMENIRAIALYDTGASVQFGDSLLVLSTCSYHTDEGRFAVLAVRN